MPFETKRVFAQCVMCGRSPVTREHLFGASLSRSLKAVGIGLPAPKSGQSILDAACHCLCRECNTDRFSAPMAQGQEIVRDLATGARVSIATDEHASLVWYFERLGFLVDVLSSNFELQDEYRNSRHFQPHAAWRLAPPAFSVVDRKSWLDGKDCQHPAIFLGRHMGELGRDPETTVNQAFTTGNEATVTACRRFHMVIGRLAIELQMGDQHEQYVPSDAYVSFASPPHTQHWPPSRDVDYDDFFALQVQDAQVMSRRHLMGIPHEREKFENWVRYRAKVAAAAQRKAQQPSNKKRKK